MALMQTKYKIGDIILVKDKHYNFVAVVTDITVTVSYYENIHFKTIKKLGHDLYTKEFGMTSYIDDIAVVISSSKLAKVLYGNAKSN